MLPKYLLVDNEEDEGAGGGVSAGKKTNISRKTAYLWTRYLGFRYRTHGKGVWKDGHDDPSNVKHRLSYMCPKLFDIFQRGPLHVPVTFKASFRNGPPITSDLVNTLLKDYEGSEKTKDDIEIELYQQCMWHPASAVWSSTGFDFTGGMTMDEEVRSGMRKERLEEYLDRRSKWKFEQTAEMRENMRPFCIDKVQSDASLLREAKERIAMSLEDYRDGTLNELRKKEYKYRVGLIEKRLHISLEEKETLIDKVPAPVQEYLRETSQGMMPHPASWIPHPHHPYLGTHIDQYETKSTRTETWGPERKKRNHGQI